MAKSGGGKPWPQTCSSSALTAAARCRRAPAHRRSRRAGEQRPVAREQLRARPRMPGRIRRSAPAGASVRRPSHGRRSAARISGARFVTRSSVSRRCTPSIERPEPRSSRVAGPGEGDRRAMELLLHARRRRGRPRPGASPRRTGDRVRRLDQDLVELREGVDLHVALDVAPFAVELVELPREFERALEAVRRQAFDADRHVGQAPGRVDARADREAEVVGAGGARRPCPATWNSAAIPGCRRPLRMRCSPCATRMRLLRSRRTTSATVPSATRSSSVVELRLRRRREARRARAVPRAARAARRTSRRRPPGSCSGKPQPGWFGLTMHAAVGQHGPGQVVVGHQHRDAESVGLAPRRRHWRCRCRR